MALDLVATARLHHRNATCLLHEMLIATACLKGFDGVVGEVKTFAMLF